MRVFLTGGTGLLGQRLMTALLARGDRVCVLTRQANWAGPTGAESKGSVDVVVGDPTVPGDWQTELARCDAVVHLAGEPILGSRWSAEFKTRLRESRVRSTENVVAALRRAEPTASDLPPSQRRPRVLLSGSAIGVYPASESAEYDERSLLPTAPSGGSAEVSAEEFLVELGRAWEAAAEPATELGVRTVKLRTGIVLDARGGALAQMLPAFRWFVGGPAGSGRQWMSWIHHADWVGLVLLALDRAELSGPLNAVAPQPATNAAFSAALAAALGRPNLLWAPSWGLRLAFGEAASVILSGQKVLPRAALSAGYAFRFPELGPALADLLAQR